MHSTELIDKLKDFMEQEARSCSMDFGCETPLYIYRMWGGSVPFEEIKEAMRDARNMISDVPRVVF